jgi:alcohol oxidase
VAVQTVPTKPLSPGQLTTRTIRARKQIVISGGTLSSPLILQRSGIGDPEKLRKAGVKPLVDLPGVGLNFQDHYLTFSVFRAKPDVDSFDDFVRGDPKVQEKVFDQWNINGTGPLATNGIDAGVKVRPTEEELTTMDKWPCPEFRSGWDSYFKNKPDKPVMHYCKLDVTSKLPILKLRSRHRRLVRRPHVDATRKVLHHVPFPRVSFLAWLDPHRVSQPLRGSGL